MLNPRRMPPHRRDGFLLAAACFLIGITFGVFADSAGLSLGKASALSLLTFTGASQFAAVSVVAGGGTTIAAVGGAVLIGARNALYGPVIGPLLRGGRFRRALGAHFVIDETTALASAQEGADGARDAFWFTGLWLFAFWNVGTVLGVVVGGAFDDPGALGLDAASKGGRWSRKALFVSFALLPLVFAAGILVAWLRREGLRAKAGLSGTFSLWFPLLMTLALAWTTLILVPQLFGVSIRTLGRFSPDLALVMIATAVTGLIWAVFRLGVYYSGKLVPG